MSELLVPVSFGELIDKITILEIKSERIKDATKLKNVRVELDALSRTWQSSAQARIDISEHWAALRAINEKLWVIEDDIREKESRQEFDKEYIELARSVYFDNDTRAKIKRDINSALGSTLVEEKSYRDYRVK